MFRRFLEDTDIDIPDVAILKIARNAVFYLHLHIVRLGAGRDGQGGGRARQEQECRGGAAKNGIRMGNSLLSGCYFKIWYGSSVPVSFA